MGFGTKTKTTERFEASNGVVVYRIPAEVFPGYMGFVHLAVYGDRLTLFDVGSGVGRSHGDIVAGFASLKDSYGFEASLEDVDQIVITHGHIDHHGGLNQVLEVAQKAQVVAHELAVPVLTNYEERVELAQAAVQDFLTGAGLPDDRHKQLMNMYMFTKQSYRSIPEVMGLRDGYILDGVFELIHVPGHTPGQLMIKIGDVLLTADHVLPETSVSLAPGTIVPHTGVWLYLESLEKAARVEGIRVAMGGHEWPMYDYTVTALNTLHAARQKVDRVLTMCDEPSTIYEIAWRIYDGLAGYSELLKLWQTGARVEYLHQLGLVRIANLDTLETDTPQPFRYVRTGL